MNIHRRNFFILGTLFGVILSVTALAVFLYLPAISPNSSKELSTDQAISLIKDKKINEANFSNRQVNFTDIYDKNYFSTVGSDATHELLYREIAQGNEANANPVKVTEEPQSSGMFWLILINALPFIFILFFTIFSLYWYFNNKPKQIQ